MKKNQELNIQFLSQENDRDLLVRQLIFHKKENQKVRDNHFRLKKTVDKIKEGEKADDIAKKLEEPLRQKGLGSASLAKLRNMS